MSTRKSYEDDENPTVIAVNPRNEVLGDESSRVVESLIETDLTVYRVDYFDDPDSLSEYHEKESPLQEDNHDPDYLAEWYDDAFILGRDGLDEVDCRKVLGEGASFEFLGGMFGDIGSVKESIDEAANDPSYALNRDLVFDYIVWPRNVAGYKEHELGSLDDLLEKDAEQTAERLSHNGLVGENIHF